MRKTVIFLICFTAATAVFFGLMTRTTAAKEKNLMAKNTDTNIHRAKTETAVFGAGCFWHVEESFRHVPGVVDTTVGYMGGWVKNPTYQQVSSHKTGHSEVVKVEYDPAKISYSGLLDVFWKIHDPTTPDRQGPDKGHQYRSVIFYYTPQQKKAALKSKTALEASGKYKNPVVTAVIPASEFYRAEEYHQRYLEKQAGAACSMP